MQPINIIRVFKQMLAKQQFLFYADFRYFGDTFRM